MDTTNRKRITAGLGIAAAAAAGLAITAGTFASFSDNDTTPKQSVEAGTLKLVVAGSAVSGPIDITNAKPGDQAVKQLIFTNDGSVPGTLQVRINKLADLENKCDQPESDIDKTCGENDGELGKNLIVTILAADKSTVLGTYSLDEWGSGLVDLKNLGAHNTKTIYISTQVNPKAGNEIQSDATSFTVEADLVQS